MQHGSVKSSEVVITRSEVMIMRGKVMIARSVDNDSKKEVCV